MRQRFNHNLVVTLNWWSTVISGESLYKCHEEAQYKHNGVCEARLSEEGGTAASARKLSLLTCMSCSDLSGIWMLDDAAVSNQFNPAFCWKCGEREVR
jgi:hypothetical protein